MRLGFLLAVTTLLMLTPGEALPQAEEATAEFPTGGIVDIGEIEIRVEPELPTVLVTIPREAPDVKVGLLERPVESMIYGATAAVKPRLGEIAVKKVEKPQKMLAKNREK